MGKNGGGSLWFSVAKKACRSPSKEKHNSIDKRSCKTEDLEQQEQEKYRRGKRRWMFRKPLNTNESTKVTNIKNHASENAGIGTPNMAAEEKRRNDIEVAMATAAVAKAAVVIAQAPIEFIRKIRPCILVKENQVAVIIQKAFKGNLVGWGPLISLSISLLFYHLK